MSDIRTVTVTSCVPKKRRDGTVIEGEGTYGPWTLYSVLATDETGLPIQEEIVCFKNLHLGEQQLEFELKSPPADHPEWRSSYTVKPLKGAQLPPPASTPNNDAYEALREADRLMLDRIAALEDAVKAMGGFASTRAQTDVPVVSVPAGVTADDEDIPF